MANPSAKSFGTGEEPGASRGAHETSHPMTVAKAVSIPVAGVLLQGDLEIPESPVGLALFAHGSGSSRKSPRNQFVARTLRESGVATLLFDLLTRDEEAADAETGALRFNIELLASRLVAVTRWVASQPEIAAFRIGYFGSSTGGAAALVAAAALGRVIGAVVSRGGRPDLAAESLPRVQAPALLIVGENDDVVLRLNRQALAGLPCEKELAVVRGATHLFEEAGTLEEVAHLASVWFRRHLKPNGQSGE
jgi:putative phosphoribosyl transferase